MVRDSSKGLGFNDVGLSRFHKGAVLISGWRKKGGPGRASPALAGCAMIGWRSERKEDLSKITERGTDTIL